MANDRPLPMELDRFSILSDLQYRGGNEWSSSCPQCGGGRNGESDRFRLFGQDGAHNARAWCRQCGFFEWADKYTNLRPDPAKIQEARELREKLLQQENRRLSQKIEQLKTEAYWKGYHDAMKEQHRALWRQAGIPDEFQDYWELGFMPEYRGNGFVSPALTIPYFEPERKPFNVQYRLTTPPKPSDKYRFTSGLKAGLWLAEPESEPKGAVLLMEGVKKGAVSFIELVAKANHKLTIVTVPSKSPSQKMIDSLKECDPVYVAFDPDAYKRPATGQISASERVAEMIGRDRTRMVRLPAKADDLFTQYRFTHKAFMNYVNQATKVN